MATTDISVLQVKVTSTGITDTANKLDKLAQNADKAEQAVRKLGTQVLASNNGLASSSGVVVALTNALLQLNSTLSSVTVQTNTNTNAIRSHTSAMRDAHDAARGLAGSLGALWVTYGNMLPLAAGLAVGASLKGIISSGAEVEHAIESLRVKGEESVETANKIRESVLSIGQGVYGPREVAKAFDALILAGLSGKEAIDAVKASLNLATAGGDKIEKAAESLVTIGTAVGATSKQYDYLADGISKAANVSLASVNSISEAVKRGSVVNKLYGATFEDILVQASALSQLGIKNSAAGTAISNFYADATGKTEKAKNALKELGMSFFDATGRAKPLVAVLEEFQERLNKFTEGKQKSLIQDIFGERGLRDVVGLLAMVNSQSDSAKNKLEEMSQAIKNAAGTSALASAQLALTTENQLKSVKNTLETTFVKVFNQIEPEINILAGALRKAFNSPEFESGLGALASGVASLIKLIVEYSNVLLLAVDGMLLWKAATVGGELFTAVAIGAQKAAQAMGLLAASTDAAAIAAGGFTRALGLVGAILAVVGTGWALYSAATHEATDKAKEKADAYTSNYLEVLEQEAERLAKTNKLMEEGKTAAEAQANATRELALAKAQSVNQDLIDAALKKRNAAAEEAAKGPGIGRSANDFARSQLALKAAQKELDDAVEAFANFDMRAREATQKVIDESKRQRELYLKEQEAAKKAAAEAAGTNSGAGEIDKELKKRISFYEGERLELERLIATYKARTEAVLQGAAAEQRVMANVERDRVLANGSNKYPSMKAYNDELALAGQADRAKFAQQNANAITEQENKITGILVREAAYQKELADGDKDRVGMLEKQTVAILKFNHASTEDLAIAKERAKVADEILRVEDARKKLEHSTGAANSRAAGMMEEANAVAIYGNTARQTAVEAAKLEVAKLRLNGTGSDAIIQARLESAAMEDLGRSYLELSKQAVELARREDIERAAGVAGVIGAESAKVQAYYETTQKALEFDKQRSESAYQTALASGDGVAIGKALLALDVVRDKAAEVQRILNKNFKLDFKVAGLRDISNTFSRLANDAAAMGESFAHVATALDGLSSSFAKLSEIQAKQGITEEERQARTIGVYGDMAQASASFFQENSKGYKTLMGVSKVFHAIEMAQSIARIGKLAIEAVLNQAKGDPYTAFARMAAMATAVAALGYAVGGGFHTGSSGSSAADVQKTQGTGSSFGDADKKSETLTKSLELLKENSDLMLPLTQSMANSLTNIESSVAGVTNLVLRSGGVNNGTNLGIQTGILGQGPSGMLGSLLSNIGSSLPLVGGLLGGLLGGIANLWGKTSKEITDAGIAIKGTVADLQKGAGYNQYANITTTSSSWFGLKKNTSSSVQTQGLSTELSQQFGMIFTNLEETLKTAATALGKDGSAVAAAIDNLVIDTKVSLKDLKGKDLTDALNAVIGKAMDDVAHAAFPQLDAFRQVGEGYAQTVIRVATSVEKAGSVLEGLGIKAIKYTDITNKTGDVAFEIVKQSIALKEAGSGVGKIVEYMTGSVEDLTKAYKSLVDIRSTMQRLGLGSGLNADTVKGAGGLSALSSALETFQSKYYSAAEQAAIQTAKVTDQFAAIGKSLPGSREELRSWIEAAAKVGDQIQVGKLLSLADAFDSLFNTLGKPSPFSDDAVAKAKKAYDDAVDAAENAYNRLETAVNKEKDRINKAKDALQDTVNSLKTVLDSLADAIKATSPKMSEVESFEDAMAVVKKAISVANGGGDISKVSGLDDAFSTLSNQSDSPYSTAFDFQRAQARANAALNELNDSGKRQLTEAEKQLDLYQQQLDKLDKTLEVAKAQLDALKGIDNSVLSLEAALANFASAISAGQIAQSNYQAVLAGNNGNGASDAIEKLYNTVLGRDSDTAGKAFWLDKINSGVSFSDITKAFYNSDEYKGSHHSGSATATMPSSSSGFGLTSGGPISLSAMQSVYNSLPKFDVGTNEVPHDMMAMVHQGERIIPAADNAELMRRLDGEEGSQPSNAEVVAKLDELIQVVMQGDVANVQKANDMFKIVRDWNLTGLPGTRSEQ